MVTIKNYRMPHNCYDCDLHNYHECDLTSESIEDDYCWNGDSREKHCPLREVEAIPKDQYENRLKADMAAMLTDFLMDIEENTSINATNSDERNGKRLMRTEILKMLEDKINSLKEAKDGENND